MITPQTLLTKSRPGSSPLGLLLFFIIFLIILFMGDMAYIFLSEECMDKDPLDCVMDMFSSEEEEAPEGSVTASGVLSGEFKGETHSVTLTLSFPLKGGDVTGSFSGDCDGTIKGSYAGGNGGVISGNAKGSCMFVLPASGNFSGTVNQTAKTVPVNGKGSVPGFSKEGSMTLTY